MKFYIKAEKYNENDYNHRYVFELQDGCLEIYSEIGSDNVYMPVKVLGTYLVLSFNMPPKFVKLFQTIHKSLILK